MSGIAPCLCNTAAALDGLDSKEADKTILEAALADARETLAAVFRALLSELATDEAVRERVVQILTCLGWVGRRIRTRPGR